ncbi:MAG TPA: antibiotic biosynthesis monooxygenase family protein [Bryobacteraceae bacterium]|nr:antibiotic biosynthesis monooxygenase family protein [Bryobacteraceae bacterium]
MSFPHRLMLVLALAALALTIPASAQPEPQLHVVTYIDVFPNFAADTAKALQDFSAASSKDPGYVRIEVMRDVDRTNHFAVVEVWRTRKDYEAHLGQAHTKQFREKIQPGLGSPFDERLYHTLP